MSSRENILKAIRKNKPEAIDQPVLPLSPADTEIYVKVNRFSVMLNSIGGKAVMIRNKSELADLKEGLIASGKILASASAKIGRGNFEVNPMQTAPELEAIDVAILEGAWGVAENGAVWLSEAACGNRLLPFITQHLWIFISAENILSDLHEAYTRIDIAQDGYGLFVAGPSKTADIEQSLVIGAHGARSTTVYIITDDERLFT